MLGINSVPNSKIVHILEVLRFGRENIYFNKAMFDILNDRG